MAVGFYGSTVGVVFQSGNSDFSIGLDCPNTVIGGNNAIRPFAVTSGTGTADAAQAAADNTDGTGQSGESITVNGGTCTVVRAHEWGNVNYALCSLTA